MTIGITRHAEARMSQRGIRKADVPVLLDHGTETGPDSLMLMKRDAARLIEELRKRIAALQRLGRQAGHETVQELKKKIKALERITGEEIVVVDGQLVTAYHRTRPARPARRPLRCSPGTAWQEPTQNPMLPKRQTNRQNHCDETLVVLRPSRFQNLLLHFVAVEQTRVQPLGTDK